MALRRAKTTRTRTPPAPRKRMVDSSPHPRAPAAARSLAAAPPLPPFRTPHFISHVGTCADFTGAVHVPDSKCSPSESVCIGRGHMGGVMKTDPGAQGLG
eukprot:4758108-Prymnesium_polylepis.1